MVAQREAQHPRRGFHEAETAVVQAVTQLWRSGLAVIDRRITHVGSVMGAVAMALVLVPQDSQIGAHAQTLAVSGNVEPAEGSPSLVTDGRLGTNLPRPADSASGSGEPPKQPETGLPGVLPDQPNQPAKEGPVEGGTEGGEGDGSPIPAAEEATSLAGGGAPQEARPPVVRRTEVSRKQVDEYPEGREDGTTVIVKVTRITFSDGKTEDRYEIVPPAGTVGAPPPLPPKVVAEPPAVEGPPPNEGFRPLFASQPGDPSFLESARASCGDKIEQATKIMLGYNIPQATAAVETLRKFNPDNFRLSNFELAGWKVVNELSEKYPDTDLPFRAGFGVRDDGAVTYAIACDPNILARYTPDRDYLHRALIWAATILERTRKIVSSQGVEGARKFLSDGSAHGKLNNEVGREVFEDRPLWDALVRAGAKTK